MNAILREDSEASVLTNEAIEVHLSCLRPAVEALQAGQIVLRDKIDAAEAKLTEKIDQANKDRAAGDVMLGEKIDQANRDRAAADAMLSEKIDQANRDRAAADAMLGEKIDQANRDRATGDTALGDKIDRLAAAVMKIQASQEGLKWFISSLVLLTSGISIAHSLGWL